MTQQISNMCSGSWIFYHVARVTTVLCIWRIIKIWFLNALKTYNTVTERDSWQIALTVLYILTQVQDFLSMMLWSASVPGWIFSHLHKIYHLLLKYLTFKILPDLKKKVLRGKIDLWLLLQSFQATVTWPCCFGSMCKKFNSGRTWKRKQAYLRANGMQRGIQISSARSCSQQPNFLLIVFTSQMSHHLPAAAQEIKPLGCIQDLSSSSGQT